MVSPQGRDNAKTYIAEHPEFAAELEAKIAEKLMAASSVVSQKAKPEVAEAPVEVAEAPKRKSKINIDIDVE